jgi:hypothetical protein
MVRTLADYLTLEPRTGDTSRRDTALASGARLVSTDYYRPDPRFAKPYVVEPVHCSIATDRSGNSARLNTVTPPKPAPSRRTATSTTETVY